VGFRQIEADLWRDWIGDEEANLLKLKGFYKLEMKDWNFKVNYNKNN